MIRLSSSVQLRRWKVTCTFCALPPTPSSSLYLFSDPPPTFDVHTQLFIFLPSPPIWLLHSPPFSPILAPMSLVIFLLFCFPPQALRDFKDRIMKYEEVYEELNDRTNHWIKLIDMWVDVIG